MCARIRGSENGALCAEVDGENQKPESQGPACTWRNRARRRSPRLRRVAFMCTMARVPGTFSWAGNAKWLRELSTFLPFA